MQNRIILRKRAHAALLAFVAGLVLLSGCAQRRESVAVAREQLFSLGYGKGEDQLDLFQNGQDSTPPKTRMVMREGIFYIANGAAGKVVRLSSFGDVLSMIYNPDRNPEPLIARQAPPAAKAPEGTGNPAQPAAATTSQAAGRKAVQYPFRSVGELAVDSRQTIYVEDRLPQDRRVFDKDLGAMLDHVILRFDRDGNSLDFLGQEGVGGTPFPFIENLYVTGSDDCVVVSLTQNSWLVDWFDSKGFMKHSMKIGRQSLPMPEGAKGLIPSLDRIAPDAEGRLLIVKVDYYRSAVDPNTKAQSGVEFDSSWAFHMDPASGAISDRWQIPPVEQLLPAAQGEAGTQKAIRIPEFIGTAGRRLFFLTAFDDTKSQVSVYDTVTRSTTRYSIDISPDELFYSTMHLSPDGILSALLGTKYEARIVWWRFDKLLGGTKGETQK